MQITVEGQNMDIGEALQTYVNDHLQETAKKYFDHVVSASVHFHKAPHGKFDADITMSVGNGMVLKASAKEDDAYGAFEHATNRIARQLRRYKGRLRDHNQKLDQGSVPAAQPAQQYILEGDRLDQEPQEVSQDNPVVVAETQTTIQTLSVGDAVMHMDLADLPAIMFKNSQTGRINMVYRRKDNNIGWLDPKVEENQLDKSSKQAAE